MGICVLEALFSIASIPPVTSGGAGNSLVEGQFWTDKARANISAGHARETTQHGRADL